jgi:hypothetical protein
MKNVFKILGIIALAAVIVFSMTACDNGSNGSNDNGGGGGGGGGGAKSIKVTGLDGYYGYSYQLGLASSVNNLLAQNLVAFAEGTIRSGTQTAPLLDYNTGNPWTGSGSYFVGVYLNGQPLVTNSKKSFNSSVTTLSINDFDYY